jgi:hypothetical protein
MQFEYPAILLHPRLLRDKCVLQATAVNLLLLPLLLLLLLQGLRISCCRCNLSICHRRWHTDQQHGSIATVALIAATAAADPPAADAAVLLLLLLLLRTVNHFLRSFLVRAAHNVALHIFHCEACMVNIALHFHHTADIGQNLQEQQQ